LGRAADAQKRVPTYPLSPIPCSLFPIPCPLSPVPYPLQPIPYAASSAST
jgi:hypothetical protein